MSICGGRQLFLALRLAEVDGSEPLPSHRAGSVVCVAVARFFGGVIRCWACPTIKGLLLTEERSSFVRCRRASGERAVPLVHVRR